MDGVRFVSLEQCFSDADVVSLHCPLTPMNREFVNKDLIALMKPSASFLNVSRGALIAEEDLAHALNDNRITGAGLDVLSTEPPLESNPLLRAKNCLITPHVAWAPQESRTRLLSECTGTGKSPPDGDQNENHRLRPCFPNALNFLASAGMIVRPLHAEYQTISL
jgi:glycerate dehydrogenase